MGNAAATLVVHTERNVYYCGDTVNGRVYLSVNDREGIVAQTLNIHFSGKEKAVVHISEDRMDGNGYGMNGDRSDQNAMDMSSFEDRYDQNETDILSFDVPINTPIGSLFQPGQYEFPFQFIVPQNLPSSMFARCGQSKCEIRYEMKAYLSKSDRSFSINPFNSNTISSKPLTLKIFGGNAPVSQNSGGPVHFPGYNHPVRNCCCCYRGSMDLRASIDSIDFVPSQDRNLSFQLKNNSRTAVENVVVEVIERVHWRPRFHEEAKNFTLIKHIIDGHSNNNWMTMQQRIEGTIQSYVSLSPTSRDTDNLTLRIPNGSRDSYMGNMIQVEHFVRVKVVTRGCCVSNPETTVDVNVFRPSQLSTSPSTDASPPVPSAPFMDEDEIVVEATVLPPDWTPQTSDTVTLPLADVLSSSPVGESAGMSYSPPKVSAPLTTK